MNDVPAVVPAVVPVDRVLLQIVFDCAVHSLDFTSGFLDDEEVSGLRAIAVLLGVDPMVATPNNFKYKYCKQHEPYVELRYAKMCCRCGAAIS